MESDSVPAIAGEEISAPPNLRVAALDCDGAAVFAAGHEPGSGVPVVWAGDLDLAARRVSWSGKVGELRGLDADDLVVGADPGSNGARVAASGCNEFSLCTGVFVFERQGGRWVESGRLMQPDGESDILFGMPLSLRGAELFTMELPGGDVPGSAVHHYRRQAGSWSRSVVPFAPDVAGLWWQMSVSPAGDSLAITTSHRDNRHYVDFHAAGAGGVFAHVQSVALPGIPDAMVRVGDRLAVGLSRSSPEGASLVFLERGASGWQTGASMALPPAASRTIGAMVAAGARVAVSAGEGLWLVDVEKAAVTGRLTAPDEGGAREGWSALASCGGSVLAVRNGRPWMFDLRGSGSLR